MLLPCLSASVTSSRTDCLGPMTFIIPIFWGTCKRRGVEARAAANVRIEPGIASTLTWCVRRAYGTQSVGVGRCGRVHHFGIDARSLSEDQRVSEQKHPRVDHRVAEPGAVK